MIIEITMMRKQIQILTLQKSYLYRKEQKQSWRSIRLLQSVRYYIQYCCQLKRNYVYVNLKALNPDPQDVEQDEDDSDADEDYLYEDADEYMDEYEEFHETEEGDYQAGGDAGTKYLLVL